MDRGGRAVLTGLGLTVAQGSVTALMGPSGCGKSTLIRSIVGVQRVRAGDVRVLGLPAGSAALRSRVAYVTQAPSVYADLTVRENLAYFARILDAPKSSIDDALATVDLGAHSERLAATLSGGERARTSLATALLGDPEVLVLDEPTVGLDPVLREALWGTFGDLAAAGKTLLVSSHVMDEAAHCGALLLMREGEILRSTTPSALLAETGAATLDAAFLRVIQPGSRA